MKKEKIKNIVLIIVLMIITSTITSYATSIYLFDSIDLKYDNSKGVQAETVQGAIDELCSCASNYSAYDSELNNLKTKIETSSLNTTNKDLSGAVNELDNELNVFKNQFFNHYNNEDIDFNNYTQTGIYLNTSNVDNKPVQNAQWCLLMVMKKYYDSGGDVLFQLTVLIGDSATSTYIRTKNGSVWSPWINK